ELEYSLLGEGALYLHRQQRLLDLAREGQLVCEQKILGDLLGDGGGALRPTAAAVLLDIQHRSAGDAGEIDAAMFVEILVLSGHKGGDGDDEYGCSCREQQTEKAKQQSHARSPPASNCPGRNI